jgi:hypothetical protein
LKFKCENFLPISWSITANKGYGIVLKGMAGVGRLYEKETGARNSERGRIKKGMWKEKVKQRHVVGNG